MRTWDSDFSTKFLCFPRNATTESFLSPVQFCSLLRFVPILVLVAFRGSRSVENSIVIQLVIVRGN